MSGTILPSLPPLADDHLVTVCAGCMKRCCIVNSNLRCGGRRHSEALETVEKRVDELRLHKNEHHSYWRHLPGDDLDMPKCIEDVKDLAAHQRAKAPDEPAMFAGYLTEELGLDQVQCRDTICDVWPEAAEAIDKWIPKAEPSGAPC